MARPFQTFRTTHAGAMEAFRAIGAREDRRESNHRRAVYYSTSYRCWIAVRRMGADDFVLDYYYDEGAGCPCQ